MCWFLYSHVLILTTFIFFYLSTCACTCIYPHVLLLSHMCLYSSTYSYPNTHVLILNALLVHMCLYMLYLSTCAYIHPRVVILIHMCLSSCTRAYLPPQALCSNNEVTFYSSMYLTKGYSSGTLLEISSGLGSRLPVFGVHFNAAAEEIMFTYRYCMYMYMNSDTYM